MITSALQSLFNTILNFVASLFPTSTGLPDGLKEAFQTIAGFTLGFSFIVPYTILFWCFGLVIGFEIGLLIFKFIVLLLKLVRGGG